MITLYIILGIIAWLGIGFLGSYLGHRWLNEFVPDIKYKYSKLISPFYLYTMLLGIVNLIAVCIVILTDRK